MTTAAARPSLKWIAKDSLQVDRSYQRAMDSRRSEAIIAKIADEFSWLKFQVITATRDLFIVDGQHRHAAALKRADVAEVPVLVLPTEDRAEAAQIFVAINRERVALAPLAVFKAELAAGVPEALKIKTVCESAGAEPMTYAAGDLKPNQTLAISTLRAQIRTNEVLALSAIRASVRAGLGLSAATLQAAFRAVSTGYTEADVAQQLASMRGIDVVVSPVTKHTRADQFFAIMTGAAPRPAPKPAAKAAVRKPFTFDRSKPVTVAAAPPAATRGDVQPRRFEMGASGVGSDDFLKKCGFEVKGGGHGTRFIVRKIGSPGKGRTMTRTELLRFTDEQRLKKGLQPLNPTRRVP